MIIIYVNYQKWHVCNRRRRADLTHRDTHEQTHTCTTARLYLGPCSAVQFKGLQAVVDSTTEGLKAIVTVFKICHEGFEALRSRKRYLNAGNGGY